MPIYYVSRVGTNIPLLPRKGKTSQYVYTFVFIQTYDKISFLRILQDCREPF